MARARHSRQSRLVEIQGGGQMKLAAAEVAVLCSGLAAEVAARYLAGAGVGALIVREHSTQVAARNVDATVRVRVASDEPPSRDAGIPRWLDELDPAARDVATGAYRALRAIRAVVLGGKTDAPLA
jgi:hypothetical protein